MRTPLRRIPAEFFSTFGLSALGNSKDSCGILLHLRSTSLRNSKDSCGILLIPGLRSVQFFGSHRVRQKRIHEEGLPGPVRRVEVHQNLEGHQTRDRRRTKFFELSKVVRMVRVVDPNQEKNEVLRLGTGESRKSSESRRLSDLGDEKTAGLRRIHRILQPTRRPRTGAGG